MKMSEDKQKLAKETSIETKIRQKRKMKEVKTVDKRSKYQNESIHQRKIGKQQSQTPIDKEAIIKK
jgi:hypothetical protein